MAKTHSRLRHWMPAALFCLAVGSAVVIKAAIQLSATHDVRCLFVNCIIVK